MIVLPAGLVSCLRGGVLAEFGSAVDLLSEQLECDRVDPREFEDALRSLDVARAVLDVIGTTPRVVEWDVVFEVGEAAFAALETLSLVRRTEPRRLQDAAADGILLPLRALPALETLIAAIERTAEHSARREREPCRVTVRRSPGKARSRRRRPSLA
jgi:hypothetical protein